MSDRKFLLILGIGLVVFVVLLVFTLAHYLTTPCSIWGPGYHEWQNGHDILIRRCIW